MRKKRELSTIFTPNKTETNISRHSTRISLTIVWKSASRRKMASRSTLNSTRKASKIMRKKSKAIGQSILEFWSVLCP